MIKGLAVFLTITGLIGLVLGVTGIFGENIISMSPWALTILGLIFFGSGISILKNKKDTDEVEAEA